MTVLQVPSDIAASRHVPNPSYKRVGLALLVTLAATTPSFMPAQQQLRLTADVSKTDFFEDEPIFLLVRLLNAGTDTARVDFFSLLSPAVTLSLRRGEGKPAAVSKPAIDHLVRPSWRGDPLPPGANILQTMVLQDIAGDEQDISRHLFAHHMSPDQYELRVEFDAHGGVPAATPLTLEANPVVLRIRKRTRVEESEVRDLEHMRELGWDTTRVGGYPRAARYHALLISWVERRLTESPDDPFVPFLLYDGIYNVGQVIAGKVPRFDPDTSNLVSRLRLAALERHRLSTAGAHLVQGMTARHLDQLALLADELGATRSGEMVRYHVEKHRHDLLRQNPSPSR